jgi:hypothetical protein
MVANFSQWFENKSHKFYWIIFEKKHNKSFCIGWGEVLHSETFLWGGLGAQHSHSPPRNSFKKKHLFDLFFFQNYKKMNGDRLLSHYVKNAISHQKMGKARRPKWNFIWGQLLALMMKNWLYTHYSIENQRVVTKHMSEINFTSPQTGRYNRDWHWSRSLKNIAAKMRG